MVASRLQTKSGRGGERMTRIAIIDTADMDAEWTFPLELIRLKANKALLVGFGCAGEAANHNRAKQN
jgi:hypothetical protein